MTIYDRGRAMVQRQLGGEKGQTGFIRRTTRVGGGATDPTGGTVTVTDTPARLVVLPVNQRDVDGTVIRTGDWSVLIEALGIEITTADRIICTEGDLAIITPGKFAPVGDVVFYSAIGRG